MVTIEHDESEDGTRIIAQSESGDHVFVVREDKELSYRGSAGAVHGEDRDWELGIPPEVREKLEAEGYTIVP